MTLSINQFSPSVMNIQPGENVTFYAPSGSTEIHNVIFDLSNGTAISDIELPFILPPGVPSEALQLAPPNNIGEPIIQNTSDGRQEIIALNKVAFHPSVVNQNGNVSYLQEHEFMQQIEQGRQQGLYMPPLSANYTMQGTEKIVSSGLILDLTGFGTPEQGGGGEGGETVPSQSTADNSTNSEVGLPPARISHPVKLYSDLRNTRNIPILLCISSWNGRSGKRNRMRCNIEPDMNRKIEDYNNIAKDLMRRKQNYARFCSLSRFIISGIAVDCGFSKANTELIEYKKIMN